MSRKEEVWWGIKMSSLEIHLQKYQLFRKDGYNQENSVMTRIASLFEAGFHLIESCFALQRLHINKHQLVRKFIEENKDVLNERGGEIWKSFQELENQIRPGQLYGGKINGEHLRKAQEVFALVEEVCLPILRKEKIL